MTYIARDTNRAGIAGLYVDAYDLYLCDSNRATVTNLLGETIRGVYEPQDAGERSTACDLHTGCAYATCLQSCKIMTAKNSYIRIIKGIPSTAPRTPTGRMVSLCSQMWVHKEKPLCFARCASALQKSHQDTHVGP